MRAGTGLQSIRNSLALPIERRSLVTCLEDCPARLLQNNKIFLRNRRVSWKPVGRGAAKGTQIHSAVSKSPEVGRKQYQSNTIPLPAGEVHLWWLEADEVQSPKLLDQYFFTLPESEQKYVKEGANQGVKKERLLARTLVRTVLGRYCAEDIPASELQFESSPSGKPWLVSSQGDSKQDGCLHFNLTHTDRLLGVAVSRGSFVGVDAEDSSRLLKRSPIDLARRKFSPREFAVLTGFENLAEQQRLFIRLWCLKEAYVKATGRGILAPPGLRAFTFELLLNIKTRPSRHRAPTEEADMESEKENMPPSGRQINRSSESRLPWKYSMDEESMGHSFSGFGEALRQEPEVVWSADSRVPFCLQFKPPDIDEMGWEAWLMELCGGHTAALVVESGRKTCSSDSPESRPKVQLKCFKTVPLVSEERAGIKYCRVIGYGRSLAPVTIA